MVAMTTSPETTSLAPTFSGSPAVPFLLNQSQPDNNRTKAKAVTCMALLGALCMYI